MSSKLLKLTLMTVAIGFILSLILPSVIPASIYLKNYWKQSKGLNGTERNIVQKCLYYGPYGDKGRLGPNFPNEFCALLYRPESVDPRDSVKLLSPREQVMREFFYLEAGQLWSFYLDMDLCFLRHAVNNSVNGDCYPDHIRYEGIFSQDLKANKYNLVDMVLAAAMYYRPAVRRLEHCFHLHNTAHPKPHFYQLYQGYEPCRQYTAMAWSLDQLPQDVTAQEKAAWKSTVTRRHFDLRTDTERPETGDTYGRMLWDRTEEAIYGGLYHRSMSIFGGPQPTEQEELQRAIQLLVMWNLDQRWKVNAEMGRLRDQLKSDKIADRAYDCLKYHRSEKTPWCNGVTYQEGDAFKDLASELYDYQEAYLRRVEELVESERRQEQVLLKWVSSQLLAFLALPEKVADHCSRQRNWADKNTASEDCLEGGLFGNLLL